MSDTHERCGDMGGLLVESRIVPVGSLRANDWNMNEMSEEVYQFLKQNIQKRGFTDAVLVTKDMTIIDGEHRWRAMKEVGATEIEVKVLDLTDEEAKAETANRSLLRGTVNQERMARVLKEVTKNKVAEEIEQTIAMKQQAIDRMVGKYCDAAPDPEEVPEPVSDFREVETTLQRGDLVILGDHKVLVGDAASVVDISILFGPELADMCVTSPPYYNQREYSQWPTYQDFLMFCDDVIKGIRSIANESSFVCCWNMGSSESEHEFIPADNYFQFKQYGFVWIEWIVWQKQCAQWNIPRSQHIDSGRYVPALRWESICVFLLGDRPQFELRDIKKVREWQENLWTMQKVLGNEQRAVGHPAMFPIELPYRCILSFSKKGALVYEPFCGSGQTILAAEQTGRRCYAMEIEPRYVEITAQRWESVTGRARTVIRGSKGIPNPE